MHCVTTNLSVLVGEAYRPLCLAMMRNTKSRIPWVTLAEFPIALSELSGLALAVELAVSEVLLLPTTAPTREAH